MNPNGLNEQDIFKTGTSISEPVPWFASLLRQFRQRSEDRQASPVHLTAAPDPAALDKFVKSSALLPSILATMRDRFSRRRPIETSSAPVEVAELWSKDNSGYSGLASVG